MKPPIILLDLGGVLIDVVSAQRLSVMMGLPVAVAAEKWAGANYLRLFEQGQCTEDAFAAGIVKELGLALPPDAFMEAFRLFLAGLYPGAEALLRSIPAGYTLACLTDTNSAQWSSLCRRTGVDRYFRHHFLSYQIGQLKPHPAVFRHVIGALACPAADILYFDDRQANVQAGLDAGMRAYQVQGVAGLRETLSTLGVLPV